MQRAIHITVLSAILGVTMLLSAPAHASGGGATPVVGADIDLIVRAPQAWLPPSGTNAQPYVNGTACGYGWTDTEGWQAVDGNFYFSMIVEVPASCAFPGAPVEILVGGFAIDQAVGWGVDVMFEHNGYSYAQAERRLVPLPSGRWGGTLLGVPAGAIVQAKVGSTVCGTAVSTGVQTRGRVVSSSYEVKVLPASPAPYGVANCGFRGAHVDFYVNGVKAKQSVDWVPGLHVLTLSMP